MIIGEEYTIEIDKLINEGYALSQINDMPVFVENACPKDIVKVKIKKINKNYLKADIVEIIKKSPNRKDSECPYSNICGSCNWMNIEYSEQLKQKQVILEETLRKIANENVSIENIIPSPKQKEYRCKIQLPISETKVSKRILSGYFKRNTHELINIKYCPMQPSIINEINEFIKKKAQELNIRGYNEITHSGLLRHVIYRISSNLEQILIIFVINDKKTDLSIKKLSKILMENYKQICGICVNFNDKKTNVIMGNNTSIVEGNDYYTETLNNIKYKVSASSFFQVNPYCAEKIFNKVKELIASNIKNPVILDAYSGVSSFGIWLSDIAEKIVSIEEVKSASSDAKENIKLNNIKNLEIINGDAATEFKKLINSNTQFDVTLIDPPRKGCSEDALDTIVKLTSKILIYVSCNPATLARDIKYLKAKGLKIIYIQPVDMFPNTYHIETIAMLVKK